jgi:hypothetical protein
MVMTYQARAPIADWTRNLRSHWLTMKLGLVPALERDEAPPLTPGLALALKLGLAPSMKLSLAPYVSSGAISSAKPRPDLAGKRLRRPGGRTAYLVDPAGYRRRMPDDLSYARLFRDGARIADHRGLETIVQGPSFSANTMLVRGHTSETLYLLDRGRKRRIAGTATLHKYCFESDRVFVVRQPLIDAMACGADWE